MDLALIERQQALEAEAVALGVDRYNRERPMPWRDDASKQEEESNLPPGQHLLRLIVPPTAEVIRQTLEATSKGSAGRGHKAMSLLLLVKPEVVAYVTARVAVNSIGRKGYGMKQTAIEVAEAVRDEVDYDAIRRNEPGLYRALLRANKKAGNYNKTWRTKVRRAMKAVEGMLSNWPMNEKVLIGVKLLELLQAAVPDLFELVQEPNGLTNRDQWKFQPTQKLREWLEKQHGRCALMEPVWMPMVVPPRPWTSPTEGGYLGRHARGYMVKAVSKARLGEIGQAHMPKVYAGVNAVQEVPWRINTKVLDTVKEIWDGGLRYPVLTARDELSLPPKPFDIDTNEESLKAWKAKAIPVYQHNAKSKSKRFQLSQLIWMAEKFAGEKAIYFPHSVDFRGRVYPFGASGPSPQGSDVQKAILEFADGKPLRYSGARWLAVHLANLFGVDKVPFDDRVGWVMENEAKILDSARNPVSGERFWMEADSPWCALAACHEWAGFVAEGPDFVSHIPIALDGSNSGLQHFSALLRDPHGAALVNLVPSERPADIYMAVAKRVQREADESEDPAAAPWKNGKVVRAIAKRPVMTYVYSATRYGMQEMIVQTLREMDRELADRGEPPHLLGADNYVAANWLSHALFAAIGMEAVAASGAMEWLRQVANVVARAGLPFRWTSPIGLPVEQDYQVQSQDRINAHFNGQRISFVLERDTGEVDPRGQTSAAAPNFIHSCDASHLMATVLRCRAAGIRHLAVIHDSFGTHAADTDILSGILRETLIEQYQDNLLAKLRAEVIAYLPAELVDEIPPLPPVGTLDLSVIREAQYAFA